MPSIFGNPEEDRQLQKALDRMKKLEMMSMLRLLALKFNEDTKLLPVPHGTKIWMVTIEDARKQSGYTEMGIRLVEFFGLYVAYCPETNILAYWIPQIK